ncbi:MAG: efflux transporter outer membrane subunit [Burkholderiales bacterium]|nr:efflux transporter outer membrane subunit [Burkholderiales bacterium]
MKIATLALSALAAAVMSACAVGPNYARPASTMPATFPHAQATTAAAPALDAWWQQFHDPVLTRIVDRALAQNLDLAAAMARVEQARAVARLSDANLMPKGEASAQAAGERQSLASPLGKIAHNFPGYQREATLYDLGAGASWEIDLFGGLHREREADRAEADAAEADGLGVRISVAAEAADAYFRVRAAQARTQIAQAQIKTDADLLDLINLRMHDGLATRREQAEAEARVAQVRTTLPPLQTELEVQLNRLDVLMGAQPGSYAAELASTPTEAAIPSLATLPAPETLLRRRPDVIAAERRLAASSARIGVATSEYYPKFSVSALLGFESLSSAEISSRTFQPQALAGLHWRLFDFGRVDAEVAKAKGVNAEALARYRQSMLRATEDVEDALITQTQLDVQRRELEKEIAASADARNSAEEAYKGGAVSLLEVLEQDRQLLSARDQLASADANTARATVAAFRALGGGW